MLLLFSTTNLCITIYQCYFIFVIQSLMILVIIIVIIIIK